MKGFVEQLLAGVILLILAVAFVSGWMFKAATSEPISEDGGIQDEGCRTDSDCADNQDGSRCLIIYPDASDLVCGCLFNEDCLDRRNGFCGTENKCV